jgi:hypothetical protein
MSNSEALTKEQRQIARQLRKLYGPSEVVQFVWGRSNVNPEVGTLIPIPKRAEDAFFTEFEEADAKKLARSLRKLAGKPVILTGGGGAGVRWKFLQGIVLETHQHQGDGRQTASVKAKLRAFPGEGASGPDPFTPYLGSWRLSAVKGYGAEKFEKVPQGWEV